MALFKLICLAMHFTTIIIWILGNQSSCIFPDPIAKSDGSQQGEDANQVLGQTKALERQHPAGTAEKSIQSKKLCVCEKREITDK